MSEPERQQVCTKPSGSSLETSSGRAGSDVLRMFGQAMDMSWDAVCGGAKQREALARTRSLDLQGAASHTHG